jgi:hypothetical protein
MFRSAQIFLAAGFGLVAATVAAEAQNGPGPGQDPRFLPPRFDYRYQAPQLPPQYHQFFRHRFGRQFAPGPFAYRYRFGPQGGQNAPNFNRPYGGPNFNPPNNQPGPFAAPGPRGRRGGPQVNPPNNNQPGPFAAPGPRGRQGGPQVNPPSNNAPAPFAGPGPRGRQDGPQANPPSNNQPGPFAGPGPRGRQGGPQVNPPSNNAPAPFAGPGPRGRDGQQGVPPNVAPPNANPPAAAANRGWLGVSVQPLDSALADALRLPSTSGALVAEVQAGSPAAAAGIIAGDVITAVDGRAVGNDRELAQIIAGDRPNMQVNLSVWRQGAQASASVTLGTAPGGRVAQDNRGNNNPPAANAPTPLGITLSQNPSRDGGVVVMSVTPNSAADRAGIVAGDLILAVGDTVVSSNGDVARAVDAARQSGARSVLMRLRTDGQGVRFVTIAFG